MDSINNRALLALQRGSFLEAQELLKKNIKINPSHMTYNNLGYFYCDLGMNTKNGRVIRADKIGMRYLMKAYQLDKSYKNCMAIGLMLRYDHDYEKMKKMFENALEIKKNYAVYYNLGSVCVALKKYDNAASYFHKAIQFSYNDNDLYASTLAYVHIMCLMKSKVDERYFRNLLYDGDEKRIGDEIAAYFFNGDYEKINAIDIETVLEDYPDIQINAMIIEAYDIVSNKNGLLNFLRVIEKYYDGDSLVALKSIIDDRLQRIRLINQYNYRFGIEDRVCCYIECPIH